jgi:hypothetical protein
MSRQLVSRSPDLQRLQDDGYDLDIRCDQLLVRVPYATSSGTVGYGMLASELTLEGDRTAANPNHVVFFVGADTADLPCDQRGQPLNELINERGPLDRGGGIVASCSFSHKPNPTYPDYYEKMTTYADMVLAYAQQLDPTATARTYPPIPLNDEDTSPFRYFDALTSRAGIGAAADRIRLRKIVIIGLGGTGSYILDAVAKCPVSEIHLYDRDILRTHNAYRSPGATTLDELRALPAKVAYLQGKYDAIHRGVIPHPEHVTVQNIDELRDADFVFVSVDAGPGKKFIINKLTEFELPFIDTGMGIYQAGHSLGGLIRTTTSDTEHRAHLEERISYAAEEDDDYDQNIQLAELNMLNAAFAVIRWKKVFGFYTDFDREYSSVYTIDGNHVINEESDS